MERPRSDFNLCVQIKNKLHVKYSVGRLLTRDDHVDSHTKSNMEEQGSGGALY